MSHISFLPNFILKQLTATERNATVNSFYSDIYRGADLGDLADQQQLAYTLQYSQVYLANIAENQVNGTQPRMRQNSILNLKQLDPNIKTFSKLVLKIITELHNDD